MNKNDLIIWGTGHRPSKLGFWTYKEFPELIRFAEQNLRNYNPQKVISGMALGWDQALAHAALNLDIPLVAAVPFKGFETRWPQLEQDKLSEILSRAQDVVYVSKPGYAAWKMQKRNEWMVDNGTLGFVLWDGSKGGTANCVIYAHKKGAEMVDLWDEWEKFGSD